MSTDQPHDDDWLIRRGMLDLSELQADVRAGRIDTVLCVFADLQGRWAGKRMDARFFLADTVHHGWEACNYLIATDVDMNVLSGFEFANWEAGYGDMKAIADMSTLRRIPWLEKTALVICDLVDEHDAPIAVSPRQILKDQLARAAKLGFTVKTGAEIEFFLFDESYEQARAKNYSGLTPSSTTIQDYHTLQTTKDEPIIGAIRRGMAGAGLIVECSKGEAGFGQHEVNFRYADALQMADEMVLYKNGTREIAALAGRSVTFMAKWTMADVGSSCHIHASLWNLDGTVSMSADDKRVSHMSSSFESFLAGLVATHQDLTLAFAPTVNSYKRFQPGSWAPTAVVWGRDNRTCGLRAVGHGSGTRIETRVPGADANPYIATAAVVAGGLHGLEAGLTLPPGFVGNAYLATDVPRIPWNIVEAIDRFRSSAVAKAAFGPAVHHHLLTSAEQEWQQFNKAVTDWEVRRNFERH
jgi:glutamine synthetase